ncbi:MAG: TauD/TfdA family dioxygenase, partial [Proteobacteria bacterium]|nr:TauD/TfdA family dioxygenase [Pseudomonadota bacterium]
MINDPSRWLYRLTENEVRDLENAARHYQSLSRDIGQISQDDFPLGHFGQHLQRLKQTLLRGVGVELIRGLPIESYSTEFIATIFCGIGAHLGSARSQNAQGHMLGHVRDIGLDANAVDTRIYQTSARQTFHTDSADVVGLLCIRAAKTGGE